MSAATDQGIRYETVAEKTGLSIHYVRSIFQPNGPGHPAFGTKRDGCFRPGRTQGTWGRPAYPSPHPQDVDRLIKHYAKQPALDGFELIDDAAGRVKKGTKNLSAVRFGGYPHLRKWVYQRCPWIGRIVASKLDDPPPGMDRRGGKRLYVSTQDIDAIITAIRTSAIDQRAKWPTLTEFANSIGMHWKTCSRHLPTKRDATPHPILGRALNAVRYASESGKGRHAPKVSWRIDPQDCEMLIAVGTIWTEASAVALLLGIDKRQLTNSCRSKRAQHTGQKLTDNEVRKLPRSTGGAPTWHLHASYVADLANTVGNKQAAADFMKRVVKFDQNARKALSNAVRPQRPEPVPTTKEIHAATISNGSAVEEGEALPSNGHAVELSGHADTANAEQPDASLTADQLKALRVLQNAGKRLTRDALATQLGYLSAPGWLGKLLSRMVRLGHLESGGQGQGSIGYKLLPSGLELLNGAP